MSDPGDASAPAGAALTNADFRRMLAEAAARPKPLAAESAKPAKPRKPKPAKKAADGEEGEEAGPSYR